MRGNHLGTWSLVVVALWAAACAGRVRTTEFTNPRFDFGFVENVAVLPLQNLTADQPAGVRATRLIITELLASGAVDVVEPGQVQASIDRISGINPTNPSTAHIVELGKALGVQGILLGSVSQSESLRSGTVSIPVVTLDVHMVETESGATVWAATHTEKGAGAGARLLGTGAEPISQTTRRCVRRLLKTLVR